MNPTDSDDDFDDFDDDSRKYYQKMNSKALANVEKENKRKKKAFRKRKTEPPKSKTKTKKRTVEEPTNDEIPSFSGSLDGGSNVVEDDPLVESESGGGGGGPIVGNVQLSQSDTTEEDETSESGGGGGRCRQIDVNVQLFPTYVMFKSALDNLEISSRMSYVVLKLSKEKASLSSKIENDIFNLESFITEIESVDKMIPLHWNIDNRAKGDGTPIIFNGQPFLLLHNRTYGCHKGPDLNKKKNDKKKERVNQERIGGGNLDEHIVLKTGNRNQPSKKTGCPVKFNVKKVVYFPE